MYLTILNLMNQEQTRMMIVACLLLTIAAGLSVLPFYFIYLLLVSLTSPPIEPGSYLVPIFSILVSYFFAYLFLFAGYHVSHILAYDVLYDVRVELASRMLHFPLGFFIETTTGDLQTTLDENVEKLELFLAHHFPEMVALIIIPSFLILLTLLLDLIMGLLIAGTLGGALCIALYARRDFAPMMHKVLKNQARLHAAILEHLQGIRIIRSFSFSPAISTRFRQEMDRYRRTAVSWNERMAPPLSLYQAVITSTLAVIVPAGGYLYLTGEMALPVFFFFLVAGTLFGRLLLRIYSILRYLNEEYESMERIGRVLKTPLLSEPEIGILPGSYTVTFDQVRFGYQEYEVLHGISFTIPEGTITAIVGPSGAGKTTIARLIPRFYEVDEGRIFIGGVDIRSMKTADLVS